jgi:phytoene dehydrogenase-like protein
MSNSYDIVAMGAGHNGLVAAAYLAKAGKKVLVLERKAWPGGGVVTRELNTPGLLARRTLQRAHHDSGQSDDS